MNALADRTKTLDQVLDHVLDPLLINNEDATRNTIPGFSLAETDVPLQIGKYMVTDRQILDWTTWEVYKNVPGGVPFVEVDGTTWVATWEFGDQLSFRPKEDGLVRMFTLPMGTIHLLTRVVAHPGGWLVLSEAESCSNKLVHTYCTHLGRGAGTPSATWAFDILGRVHVGPTTLSWIDATTLYQVSVDAMCDLLAGVQPLRQEQTHLSLWVPGGVTVGLPEWPGWKEQLAPGSNKCTYLVVDEYRVYYGLVRRTITSGKNVHASVKTYEYVIRCLDLATSIATTVCRRWLATLYTGSNFHKEFVDSVCFDIRDDRPLLLVGNQVFVGEAVRALVQESTEVAVALFPTGQVLLRLNTNAAVLRGTCPVVWPRPAVPLALRATGEIVAQGFTSGTGVGTTTSMPDVPLVLNTAMTMSSNGRFACRRLGDGTFRVCRSIVHVPYGLVADDPEWVRGLTHYCDTVGLANDPMCRCVGEGVVAILDEYGEKPGSALYDSLRAVVAPCVDRACITVKDSYDSLLANVLGRVQCSVVLNSCNIDLDVENSSIGGGLFASCNFEK